MSIVTVRARLAEMQASIPGVRRAYDQLPVGIVNTADLPLFLNFVRDTEYDIDSGEGFVYDTRTYVMWLLVKPVAEGTDSEGEQITEPFIPIVADYFISRPSLLDLKGVVTSELKSDSGPKRMVWPGTPSDPIGVYWGIEFVLDVTEVSNISYTDY